MTRSRVIASSALTALLLLSACGDDDARIEMDAGTDAGTVDAGSADAGSADAGADAGALEDAAADASEPGAPTALSAEVDARIETAFVGQLEGTDPDGDALTFAVVSDPSSGTLAVEADTGAFTYTPEDGFTGEDAFTFEVSDGGETSAPATVSLTVHYVTNGTLDPTFAGDGVQVGPVSASLLSDLVVLDDGRIVAAGNSTSADLLLVGYEADGDVDATFGSGGTVVADIAGGYDGFGALARQSSGRLIAVGQAGGASRDMLAAAYSEDGALDTDFGTDGYAILDFDGGSDSASALVVLADDSILLGGYSVGESGDEDFTVARLGADGALDTSFGTDGWARVDFEGADDRVEAMVVDGMGRIVLAGDADFGDGSVEHIAAARLLADGTLDASFGTDGETVVELGELSAAQAVELGADGRIWLAGSRDDGTADAMVVVALGPDGTLDTRFDEDGWVTVPFGDNQAYAQDLLVQPDGSLLVVGSARTGASALVAAIASLLPDGSPDEGFDEDGWATFAFGTQDIFFAVRRQPDGRALACGWARSGQLEPLMVRFAR
ncbi:MAG TPA: cadherin-like domain-containing protein [Polyangiaceae bacterium LLY-WYZ-15_(1-7)]|nr:cadherin-like domain-containing protein [Polyangiaceae bacterium LLY-WYZ-15_(1-7)]HJL02268.1 cadherin-like domain-containing protein [Polyangiaceae bacterium LLY-WYZ-15_(1-7)]HJL09298.1 cadherin-like domain-containing protein [Polyangiaceae bacterium LLY-WYZ-15_(1-7)]HJL38646.1 cadherin-like domain-containing protein [Polyangiaceae bacterium LLY-WYZ-15_(1-7)]HJL45492.1 cadherin-like domain-containing protein [Polyangiaceae bacterium LLY-WYZ-15_(1-7)]